MTSHKKINMHSRPLTWLRIAKEKSVVLVMRFEIMLQTISASLLIASRVTHQQQT